MPARTATSKSEDSQREPYTHVPKYCLSTETRALVVTLLARYILPAFNAGYFALATTEKLFMSALQVVKILVTCSRFLSIPVRLGNETRAIVFEEIGGIPQQPVYVEDGTLTIGVLAVEELKDEHYGYLRGFAYSYPDAFLLVITRKEPGEKVDGVKYVHNLFASVVRDVVSKLNPHREKYVGRVPYTILIYGDDERVEEALSKYSPPPPAYARPLVKNITSIAELVMPEEVKKRVVSAVKAMEELFGGGNILLVGLPGSGRRTLAYAIAEEMGRAAYEASMDNFMSKYVGESESKFRTFFESVRTLRAVVALSNVSQVFRVKEREATAVENLRSLLRDYLSRTDYETIFFILAEEDTPHNLLGDPYIGLVKLVVPPPPRSERTRLARMFLDRLLDELGVRKGVEAAAEAATGSREAIYAIADSYAEVTPGYTPGALLRLMWVELTEHLERIAKTGRFYVPEPVAPVKRDLKSVLAILNKLREVARSIGDYAAKETIEKVMDEVRRLIETRSEEQGLS